MKRITIGAAALAAIAVAAWLARDARDRAPATAPGAASAVSSVAAGGDGVARAAASDASAAPDPALAERAEADVAPPASDHASESAPVRLRLVDEHTREPVPRFRVRLTDARGTAEDLASDERGVLAGTRALALGLVTVELQEHVGAADRIQIRRREAAAIARELVHEHRASLATLPELAIPVGPTYLLDCTPPASLGFDDLDASLRCADARQAFDVAFARVRDDGAPWVRFAPGARLLTGGPPWTLEITARDGLWAGRAQVASIVGVHRATVSVVLEPRARIAGRVVDGAGEPVVDHYLRLERDGASFDDPTNRPLVFPTGDEGRFDRGGIPPATYWIRTSLERHDDYEERIELAGGETRTLDIALVARDEEATGRIHGRIESVTGLYDRRVYVALESREEAFDDGYGAELAWVRENGRAVARFAFEGLRPGRYHIRPTAAGFNAIEPPELVVETDVAPLAFVVLDGGERTSLRFDVLDEAGEPLVGGSVSLGLETAGGTIGRGPSARDGGRHVFDDVPAGATCQFTVAHAGKRPVFGTMVADASRTEPTEIRMRPGWGAEILVVDADRVPLAGARILLGDELAGETDTSGSLRVDADRPPERIHVELDGRRIVDGDVSPVDGAFRDWHPWLRIVLGPPDER